MPRRGENIYKRKDGRWEARYMKSHVNGKAQYSSVYAKTYKEVKEKLASKISTVEKESIASDRFEIIALEWLSSIRTQLKESSSVKYLNIINTYLLPTFESTFIDSITKDNVSDFCNSLLSGDDKRQALSPKTVTSAISVLKSIFDYASQVKQYKVVDISGVSVKQAQQKLRVLSIAEQQRLGEYLLNHQTPCNLGILLCLYTGLRIGEVCALKWEDILFDEQAIYVHRTMQRLQTKTNSDNKTEILISTPKSDCSIRKIPIPDTIFNLIVNAEHTSNAYFLTGLPNKYIEPRTMQNRFKRIIRYCDIEDANFHALRHTFATRCVEVGFDVKSLSEILGHANVNITLNRYVHPTMATKQKNMNKLSELFTVK